MNVSRIALRAPLQPLVSHLARSYALSRFPKKHTGTGRARNRPQSISRDPDEPDTSTWREQSPSQDNSTIWQAAQRSPSSDPQQGLKHLLMDNDTLIVERQVEMLNIFVGFEQANKYAIHNEAGETLGYILEEQAGFFSMLRRQAFATHRPFRAVIMDAHGTPLLWVRRPFAWINSRMYVQRLQDYDSYSPEGEPVLDTFAEVQQVWHIWRRRYDLFLQEKKRRVLSLASDPQPEPPLATFQQIAQVDSGFLAWRFPILDENGKVMAVIDRAWRGFGREIFTDTGRYSILFNANVNDQVRELGVAAQRGADTLDRRALLLALAVNVDFDYFSRHSHTGPGGGIFHFGGWD
ncbi:Scramblase-domain-containing protein [Coprinellus micaceus]|uniref:Phospholipid scramblase n=1 Tax=Coprinellus micaceus TaxID=71717 RepID=A0A4Y7TQW2_COPMI|nr:Scramblase-domain-containing protein [Coprinellus micaceus]